MSRWGVTPRVLAIRDLDSVVGKRVSTNLSPTFRARLLAYDQRWGYFKVEACKKKGYGKYNHCAGQIIEIPTQFLPSMCWLTKQGQR